MYNRIVNVETIARESQYESLRAKVVFVMFCYFSYNKIYKYLYIEPE